MVRTRNQIQQQRQGYSVTPCQPYNATNPPIAPLLWMFYISKIFDFADTAFIILGKKWNQLSFLHVYHHVTIFLVRATQSKPTTMMPHTCLLSLSSLHCTALHCTERKWKPHASFAPPTDILSLLLLTIHTSQPSHTLHAQNRRCTG